MNKHFTLVPKSKSSSSDIHELLALVLQERLKSKNSRQKWVHFVKNNQKFE